MAEGAEGGPAPEVPEKPALTIEAPMVAPREVQGTSQVPSGDRYRLEPQIFGDEGDVEQFIRKFEDVATIAEWPAPALILLLRACLTGRAKSYALGPDEAHIMRALRPHFGLMEQPNWQTALIG